jgi:hypothetical protein
MNENYSPTASELYVMLQPGCTTSEPDGMCCMCESVSGCIYSSITYQLAHDMANEQAAKKLDTSVRDKN